MNDELWLNELKEQVKFLQTFLATCYEKSPENNPEYWKKISEDPAMRELFFKIEVEDCQQKRDYGCECGMCDHCACFNCHNNCEQCVPKIEGVKERGSN